MTLTYINTASRLPASHLQLECTRQTLSSEDIIAVKRMLEKRAFFWKYLLAMAGAVLVVSCILYLAKAPVLRGSFVLVPILLLVGVLLFALVGRRFVARPAELRQDLANTEKEVYRTTVTAIKRDRSLEPELDYAVLQGSTAVLGVTGRLDLRVGDAVIIERLPVSGNVLAVRAG